jgi:hypothetical protein
VPEVLWHVKSIAGFTPLGQPTLLGQLQGIPTLDDSATKGHYTNFNLVFKVSIWVCSPTSNCYHGRICEGNLWLHAFFESYEIDMRYTDFTLTEVSI